MQETRVRSLGQEDTLEKKMATRSSILAWEIPWTEEPGRLQSMGLQTVEYDFVTENPHTRPLTFGLPFYPSHPIPLGHHRTPSRAPCATQQIPTSCFTHRSGICPTSSPNSSSPSHCVHTSILYICIPTLAMGLSSSVM